MVVADVLFCMFIVIICLAEFLRRRGVNGPDHGGHLCQRALQIVSYSHHLSTRSESAFGRLQNPCGAAGNTDADEHIFRQEMVSGLAGLECRQAKHLTALLQEPLAKEGGAVRVPRASDDQFARCDR